MLILALAAISLGGYAISWVNGRRTEAVQRDVDRLGVQYNALLAEADGITAAEDEQRWRLVGPYVRDLADLARSEADWRRQALAELRAAIGPAAARMGDTSTDLRPGFFNGVVFELEIQAARLGAELAHVERACGVLDRQVSEEDPTLPAPTLLICPPDAPHDGALVQLADGQTSLHGYRITRDTVAGDPGHLLALYDVQHAGRTARACPVRGRLLAAVLKGEEGLDAEVARLKPQGLVASFYGVGLTVDTLPRDGEGLRPGDAVTLYPADWTLSQILAAPQGRHLPASATRRVSSRPDYWSPIPLEVSEEDLAALTQAWGEVDDSLDDEPWAVENDGEHVLFSLGTLTLRLAVDADSQCFRLTGLLAARTPSIFAIPVGAELNVFTPGGRRDPGLQSAPFADFVVALAGELQSHRAQTLRRQGAIELRELVSVYDDQMQAEIEDSGQPLFVLSGALGRHRATVDALLLGPQRAPWLAEILDGRFPRAIKAVAGTVELDVTRVASVPELGVHGVRITVDLPADALGADPEQITRLVNAAAGHQQRTRITAINALTLDEYESADVRSALLATRLDVALHGAEGSGPVYDAVSQSEGLFAVWGPPGTGKTTLIVRLIQDAFASADRENRPMNVLVTAPTHVAVDEILERLLAAVPDLRERTVRYGAEDKVAGTPLADVWHQTILEEAAASVPPPETDPLADRWRTLTSGHASRAAASRWILRGRSVHGATCIGMVRQEYALTDQAFDLVIVDEAGKAFLSDILVPARRAKRLVLVGDHRQLPPTVTQDVLDRTIGYRLSLARVEQLLRTNAFHRLFDRLEPDQKGMLNVQYRMDPAIGDAVSHLFYDGQLASGRSSNPWPWSEKRLTLLDFSRVQAYRNKRDADGSQHNGIEAEVLVDLVGRLNDAAGDTMPQTLVICPYAGQRALVTRLLRKAGLGGVAEVATVDAVQGGEADLVFLLMTRSQGRTDFLLDEHRLNVALSRAREAVVILGHADHLRCPIPDAVASNPFERLVRHGEASGSLRTLRLPSDPVRDDVFAVWNGAGVAHA